MLKNVEIQEIMLLVLDAGAITIFDRLFLTYLSNADAALECI